MSTYKQRSSRPMSSVAFKRRSYELGLQVIRTSVNLGEDILKCIPPNGEHLNLSFYCGMKAGAAEEGVIVVDDRDYPEVRYV